ncbi:hypothetical protein ACA910_007743 [Epithemia clementina (nom. ined.)]
MRTANHVLFRFIPNWIGYSRVVLALLSFVVMVVNLEHHRLQYQQQQQLQQQQQQHEQQHPEPLRQSQFLWPWGLGLYLSSFVGDLFDGWAARYWNQTSSFGAVLDMVTDRCATLGLLMILAMEYAILAVTTTSTSTTDSPIISLSSSSSSLSIWYLSACLGMIALAILDMASHWFQMYASLAVGGAVHHKSAEGNRDRHFLVQWFYKYYWFFGYLCVGAEFTYVLLYLQIQYQYQYYHPWQSLLPRLVQVCLYICLPGCAMKQVVNVAQLTSASRAIAAYDARLYNERNHAATPSPQAPQAATMDRPPNAAQKKDR